MAPIPLGINSFRRKISLTVQRITKISLSRAEPAFSARTPMRRFLRALKLALEPIACTKNVIAP